MYLLLIRHIKEKTINNYRQESYLQITNIVIVCKIGWSYRQLILGELCKQV